MQVSIGVFDNISPLDRLPVAIVMDISVPFLVGDSLEWFLTPQSRVSLWGRICHSATMSDIKGGVNTDEFN
jgi:hypothetical protein